MNQKEWLDRGKGWLAHYLSRETWRILTLKYPSTRASHLFLSLKGSTNSKLDEQFGRFLKMMRKLYVNIPFTKASQQMSTYSKFLKDILSHIRKVNDFETIYLTEECSAIIKTKLPLSSRTQVPFIFFAWFMAYTLIMLFVI